MSYIDELKSYYPAISEKFEQDPRFSDFIIDGHDEIGGMIGDYYNAFGLSRYGASSAEHFNCVYRAYQIYKRFSDHNIKIFFALCQEARFTDSPFVNMERLLQCPYLTEIDDNFYLDYTRKLARGDSSQIARFCEEFTKPNCLQLQTFGYKKEEAITALVSTELTFLIKCHNQVDELGLPQKAKNQLHRALKNIFAPWMPDAFGKAIDKKISK